MEVGTSTVAAEGGLIFLQSGGDLKGVALIVMITAGAAETLTIPMPTSRRGIEIESLLIRRRTRGKGVILKVMNGESGSTGGKRRSDRKRGISVMITLRDIICHIWMMVAR